ncbi:MAG: Ig-like domain repeat protein [Acidobacteria bacterium]|nr:Ig-like domain repeat protein [Acidobacteriota bacterium]
MFLLKLLNRRIVLLTLCIWVALGAHAQLPTTTTLSLSTHNAQPNTPVTIQISVSDGQGPVTAGVVDLFSGSQLIETAQLVHSNTAGFTPGTATIRHVFGSGLYALHAAFRPSVADAASSSPVVQLVVAGTTPAYTPTPVYKNTRDFTFGTEHNLITAPVVADFNGDGVKDMAVAMFSPARIAIAAGDPARPGEFLAPQFLNVTAGDLEYVYPVDANADGLIDLIALSVDDGTLFYFQNDPAHPGSFLAPVSYFPNVGYPMCRVGDMDLDGFPDIVCIGAPSNHSVVQVLLNDATHPGTFQRKSSYSLPGLGSFFTLADFNGDHFPDLAIGEPTSPGINIVFGSSTNPGTFVSSTHYVTSSGIADMESGDLNGDGLPDLIFAQGPYGVGVMLNQTAQPGVFGPIQNVVLSPEAGPEAYVVQVGAVDGDTNLDIVAAGTNNYVSIVRGRGDGTFEAPLPLMTGPTAPAFSSDSILLADVDGDAQGDIVTVGYPQSSVEIFRHSFPPEELIRTATDISGPTSIRKGQLYTLTITETATSGAPTGEIEIYDTGGGATFISQGRVPITGTSAVYQTSTLALGFHTFSAVFHGDAVYAPSQSRVLGVVVVNAPTAGVVLTANPNPATVGQTVNLHAVVNALTGNAGQPTGTVTFLEGSSVLGTASLVAGTANFNVNTLARGTHVIVARYDGNADYQATTSPAVNLVIVGGTTSTALSASPNPVPYQAGTTLTAAVTANVSGATGNVTFYEGTNVLGSGLVDASGIARLGAVQLSPGTHLIYAVYSGDTSFEPSTSPAVTVTVLAAPTTVTAAVLPPSPVAFQNVQLRATVSSAASPAVSTQGGTVTFFVNGNVAGKGVTDASGVAVANVVLPAGPYTLTASFAATSILAASTSAPLAFTVERAPTVTQFVISPSPVFQQRTVTLQAGVSAPASTHIPDGTVSFMEGANVVASGTLDAQGKIRLTTSFSTTGLHILVATYSGSANYLPSSFTLSMLVLSNDFSVSADPPSLSIQTEHHAPLSVAVHSIGGFQGTVALSCADLPVYASCTFDKQAITLAAGETATTRVVIDTDTVLGYASVRHEGRNNLQLCLLGLGALALFAVPRRAALLRSLLLMMFLFSTLWLSGCSARYPDHTPPGTYTIQIVGSEPALGVRTSQFSLVITP